jgi:hypothetical protein
MLKMSEKNNGNVTKFFGQHIICENNADWGSVEKYFFIKISVERNNNMAITKANVKLHSDYSESNFSVITKPHDFINSNKEMFMEKLNNAIVKVEDQVKDEKVEHYKNRFIADDNLREQFWLYFEQCRNQVLGNNKGKIKVWNINEIKETLSKENLKKSINEKLSNDNICYINANSYNEYEDNEHNIFINITMEKGYRLDCTFNHFQIRIVNGFWGHRNEAFNMFSEKTKGWMTMDKATFMKKMNSMANSSINFKVQTLSSPKCCEAIWAMFSTLRNEFVPAIKYCDELKRKMEANVVGA